MPTTVTNKSATVLIASADQLLARDYARCLEEGFSVSASSNLTHVLQTIDNNPPAMLLVDPKLLPGRLAQTISEVTNKFPGLRVMVIENQTDRSIDQYELFKSGAHGFCHENISSTLLNRAVKVVCEGEFWIQRKLIAQVIGELSRETDAALQKAQSAGDNQAVAILTPRELEVARMVHLGGNNKTIARELDISERTVKAHLSAIFRKLNIENRLHLALFFNQIS